MLRVAVALMIMMTGPALAYPSGVVADYKRPGQARNYAEEQRVRPSVVENYRLGVEVRAGRMTLEESIRRYRELFPQPESGVDGGGMPPLPQIDLRWPTVDGQERRWNTRIRSR